MTTMTTEEVRQMLERFYNAETTDREEAILKDFFLTDDIPADLQTDKTLFDQLYAPEADTPSNFGLTLAQTIERWNVLEKTTLRKARTVSMRRIAGVAASMLMLFSLGTYLNHRQSNERPYAGNLNETYDNPNDAAGETERALTKFSIAINKGLNKINNLETNQRQ